MGKATRASAREKVRVQRELERKREQRKRQVTVMLTVAGVVLLIIAAVAVWQSTRNKAEVYSGPTAPISRQENGDVVMAAAGVTAPVLDIYEDFQCPYCKTFEETSGARVRKLAAEGKVKVVFHPITIFSQDPPRANSVRAAAAMRCVPGGTPWLNLHNKIFAQQPAEGSTGFSIDNLIKWGKEAGVTGASFDSCVRNQQYASAQETYSANMIKSAKVQGTPSVRLAGKDLGNAAFVPGDLEKAILNAKSK
jgi:protein-disulfide isomerase